MKPQKNPHVVIRTELGEIIVEIDVQNAPISASNFLRYVDEDQYAGSSFYRVVRMDNQPENHIKIEVIQGGYGFAPNERRFPPIEHETTATTGILHTGGTISLARNAPGTASAEFFYLYQRRTGA